MANMLLGTSLVDEALALLALSVELAALNELGFDAERIKGKLLELVKGADAVPAFVVVVVADIDSLNELKDSNLLLLVVLF